MVGPKLKHGRRVRQVGLRILLLRVNKIRKIDRVTKKKHRGIVAHYIVVTLPGIEFDRETTRIARIITGILASANG